MKPIVGGDKVAWSFTRNGNTKSSGVLTRTGRVCHFVQRRDRYFPQTAHVVDVAGSKNGSYVEISRLRRVE